MNQYKVGDKIVTIDDLQVGEVIGFDINDNLINVKSDRYGCVHCRRDEIRMFIKPRIKVLVGGRYVIDYSWCEPQLNDIDVVLTGEEYLLHRKAVDWVQWYNKQTGQDQSIRLWRVT